MSKKSFSITAQVWKWQGNSPWYFINVDKKRSEQIRAEYGKGLIPVSVMLGSSTWKTSLLPHLESNMYLIAIKKSIRRAEQIVEGSTVVLTCVIQKTNIQKSPKVDIKN
mgnify:CR=1 FL=1